MLTQVRRLITEHRRSPDFHRSQQDPAYLQLMIMEQALQARVQEQNMDSGVQMGAETKRHIDSATRKGGKNLSPDEQAAVTSMATMKKEAKKSKPMVREQSELQQAQVVLAAQDMIDRVQGMLEDISEMQFKDLPALADSIKNDMGVEQSTQFQSAASTAFTNLLQAVQAGKTELESAQGVLTGQPMVMPGSEPATGAEQGMEPGMEQGMEPGAEQGMDLSLDANLEPDQQEPETGTAALGRERR